MALKMRQTLCFAGILLLILGVIIVRYFQQFDVDTPKTHMKHLKDEKDEYFYIEGPLTTTPSTPRTTESDLDYKLAKDD